MSERPHMLDELGEELERVAALHFMATSDRARGASGGRPRRHLSVLAACLALLLLAAAATAAVLLIQQGSPLPQAHNQDLRSSGIPLPGSARLAGLDAPDPDNSDPKWDLRLSRTRSGETCTAVGQVLDGRFGIVGLDHVFRELPLGSVDSCGIDDPDGPILIGAHDFIGSRKHEARTVLSGVAGANARSVTAYVGASARHLKLGAQGSFITVYAGAAEEVQPRVVVVTRDGQAHRIELERSSSFQAPDPSGGSGWAASTEADLAPHAAPDEDCVQVTREPSQDEPSQITLPLTPEICGHLSTNPLIVQMRRFVPGEDATPFPWGNAPARTIVYGIATPRVTSLTLRGAGAPRKLVIDAHGGAFLAVLDGHVDPRSLTLIASLRGGGARSYSRPTELLSSQDNRPLLEGPVPPYRQPALSKTGFGYPSFQLEIPSTVRETLRAEDPARGPEWVMRSWLGRPNPRANEAGEEGFVCEELGVFVGGRLVEPGHRGSSKSYPLTYEQGHCSHAKELRRRRYAMELQAFVEDPNEYIPHPARTVISGLLPPGAEDPVLIGAGPKRRLPVDSNDAFLIVLAGRFWNSSPRIVYLLHGHRVGRALADRRTAQFPLGSFPRKPQVRAPDPDGGAPWGFAATARCSTAIGRVVEDRFASIDLSDGVLKSGPEGTGTSSSCSTHPEPFTPARILRQPVEFDERPVQLTTTPYGRSPERFSRPQIERRTLPGRTIITGVAHPDVVSVTLSTPSDVRTLRPSGPLHTILAVYDGFFLRGKITATVRLRGGRTETQQIDGPGLGPLEPPTPRLQLSEARRLLTMAWAQAKSRGSNEGLVFERAHLEAIERHVRFERLHPGLLPAE